MKSPNTVLVVAGAASFSTRDVWEGYVDGMRKIGIEVIPYPTFSMLNLLGPDIVGNDIIGRIVDVRNGIDTVIFIDGLYFRGDRRWVPESLARLGVRTALVLTDDPYEPLEAEDDVYTIVYTNEKASASAYRIYLPVATVSPPDMSQICQTNDLVFIGTVFPDRWPTLRKLAKYCEDLKITFRILGHFLVDASEIAGMDHVEVINGTIPAEEKWKEYASSKVVLNIFRESEFKTESPNPRVFEVTALGRPALLSGPHRKEMHNIFGDSVYHYMSFDNLTEQLRLALKDEVGRAAKVRQARKITLESHLYEQRAAILLQKLLQQNIAGKHLTFPLEDDLCWIHGAGRTGSTWLAEMLSEVDSVCVWNEPYFGDLAFFFKEKADVLSHKESFFSLFYEDLWNIWLRSFFYDMVSQRFGWRSKGDKLVVKDVNSPGLTPILSDVFPKCKFLLLIRDPFDVLDSYLDMQRPNAWNEQFSLNFSEDNGNITYKTAKLIHRLFRTSTDAYKGFPSSQKMTVRYEDLVNQPIPILRECFSFLSLRIDEDTIYRIVEKYQFKNFHNTGRNKFRRYGKVGVWTNSPNFDPETQAIAREQLGEIREELGYAKNSK